MYGSSCYRMWGRGWWKRSRVFGEPASRYMSFDINGDLLEVAIASIPYRPCEVSDIFGVLRELPSVSVCVRQQRQAVIFTTSKKCWSSLVILYMLRLEARSQ